MLNNTPLNLVTLLLFLSACLQSNAQTITTPSSADTLYSGDSCVIKWKDFAREHKRVNIELYRGENVIEKLADSERNWKKFTWDIPPEMKPDLLYRFKLSDAKYHCYSEKFLIKKPSIAITEPNSESKWRVGSTHRIKWEPRGGIGQYITIQLSRNDKLKKTFTTKVSNRGSYGVFLSDSLKVKSTSEYIIVLKGKNDTTLYSVSQPFKIINEKLLFRTLTDIPLVWMPDKFSSAKLSVQRLPDFKNTVFNVMQFSDEREDTSLIGENVERPDKRLVTVDESVSKWCQDKLLLLLKEGTLTVNNSNYDIAIKGRIKKFFILEGGSYNATIAINFQALSKDGDILWEGTKKGAANNWGNSYKAINYYECISNAYLDIINNLFTDTSFTKAITQGGSNK